PPPPPPGPPRPAPEANRSADNSAAVARLGGKVDYGHVDPSTGQRSGVRATITPAMVAAAAHDELGSAAAREAPPPTLSALTQPEPTPRVRRDYEPRVAGAAGAGETVRYNVRPI